MVFALLKKSGKSFASAEAFDIKILCVCVKLVTKNMRKNSGRFNKNSVYINYILKMFSQVLRFLANVSTTSFSDPAESWILKGK